MTVLAMKKNGLTGAQTRARVIQGLVLERSGQANIMRTLTGSPRITAES